MSRREVLPTAIEAGCDLFLFFNDPDEDMAYMKEGYLNGLLSEERLHDALRRSLGLKAKLGLHKKVKEEILPPKQEAMAKIGLPDNRAIFREVADKSITLVKDKQKNIFPISPQRYPRVLLVPVKGIEADLVL